MKNNYKIITDAEELRVGDYLIVECRQGETLQNEIWYIASILDDAISIKLIKSDIYSNAQYIQGFKSKFNQIFINDSFIIKKVYNTKKLRLLYEKN